MKAIKLEVSAVVKELKSLTKMAERLGAKLDRIIKSDAAKAKKAAAKAAAKAKKAAAKAKKKAKKKAPARKAKPRVKAKAKKKATKKAKKKATKKATKKAPAKKAARVPASDVVIAIVKKSKRGVRTADLQKKTKFKEKKIRDIIYRLKKQGKIKSIKTGLYVMK